MPQLVFMANVNCRSIPDNVPSLIADLDGCTLQGTPVR